MLEAHKKLVGKQLGQLTPTDQRDICIIQDQRDICIIQDRIHLREKKEEEKGI